MSLSAAPLVSALVLLSVHAAAHPLQGPAVEVPPTRVIVFDEVLELVVEKPPRWTAKDRKPKREYDGDTLARARSLGSSLVAIPVAAEDAPARCPRCVFGLQLDGPGSIWFITATGVDPESFTPGPEHGELSRFGFAFHLAGDHDGDGVPDLWVSAPGRLDDPGKVFLVSTLERKVLRVLSSPEERMRFGTAMCAVPDQDGDGIEDVAVFAEEQAPGGRYHAFVTVYVYSTTDGEIVQTPIGGLQGGAYGCPQLAWIPTGDGESAGLLLVSVYSAEPNRLIAIRLPRGERAWTLYEESRWEHTAWSLASTPDRDGDGVPEVLVGDLGWRDAYYGGRARVVSGLTGKVLFGTAGMWASHDAGFSLARYGDFEGDGIADHLVTDQMPIFEGGSVLVISGVDGSAVKRLTLSSGFWSIGRTLDVGADWDGKGKRDICLSSWVPTAGGRETAAVIGVISIEEGRYLHRVVLSDLMELIWQREHGR